MGIVLEITYSSGDKEEFSTHDGEIEYGMTKEMPGFITVWDVSNSEESIVAVINSSLIKKIMVKSNGS